MVIAPARRAGDPGSIPGPGENFSLKLLIRVSIIMFWSISFISLSHSKECQNLLNLQILQIHLSNPSKVDCPFYGFKFSYYIPY